MKMYFMMCIYCMLPVQGNLDFWRLTGGVGGTVVDKQTDKHIQQHRIALKSINKYNNLL